MSNSDPVYTFNAICEAMAAFVGLIFNGYIQFVLLCSKLTVNNILLLFMALANTGICLLILIASTPMTLIHSQEVPVFDNSSSLGLQTDRVDQWACDTQGALWTVLPLCMIWSICGQIVDRYLAIIEPLSYPRLINVRKTAIVLILVWICLISLSFPPLLGSCEYKFMYSFNGCVIMCSHIQQKGFEFYYMGLYFSAFVVPIVIIIISNGHILMIARNHRHRIVSAIYEISLRAQATVTHQSGQSSPNLLLKYKGKDALVTIVQLVGSLIVLTIPYYTIFAYKTYIANKAQDDYWTSTSTLLMSFTPIVNGYVYGVKSKALRKTFKRLLQRYLYEQQASIEIDRRLSLRSQSSLREGWNSLLTTTSLTSNVLYRSQRRNSAPFSFSPVVIINDNHKRLPTRRQSLENFNDTQLKTFCDTCVPLTKRPSFLAETKLTNKTPLSPIQEISFCENSSFVNNSE